MLAHRHISILPTTRLRKMAKRYFTSDLHFSSMVMVEKKLRPFKTIDKMNEVLIKNINARCNEDDILIHVGDLAQYGNDRTFGGVKIKPKEYINKIRPMVVNIEGNHDPNNRVKSVCTSMRTTMGKFKSVSIGHFPSTDPLAKGSFKPGDVHIHGHVHSGPIFTIDKENQVLNVNVCCDLWKFRPISEDDLVIKIDQFMRSKLKNKFV